MSNGSSSMISGSFFVPESLIKSSKSILSPSPKNEDKSTSPSPESEEKKSSISIETSPSGSDFGAGISLFSKALKSTPGISKPSGKPKSGTASLTIEEFSSITSSFAGSTDSEESIKLSNSSSIESICSCFGVSKLISSDISNVSGISCGDSRFSGPFFIQTPYFSN